MKGGVNVFMSSIFMVMIGVGIIWLFRSVIPSEAFIVSERHRESFSTLNYAELARKTLEEAVVIYAQTGASKAGEAGGLDKNAPQKDKIAIWKTAPDEATIKDTLKRYIAELELDGSMAEHDIPGKFLNVKYGNANIQIIPDNANFSKSEKFYVKGDKQIKISKGLQTQAINIATSMKGYIDQTFGLKYFALYDAAKQFLSSGEPVNKINAAFKTVNTIGELTNQAPKCTQPAAWCDNAITKVDGLDIHQSQTCPISEATQPADAEVRAATDFPVLNSIANRISGAITGSPFATFNARLEKYTDIEKKAGYSPGVKAVTTGSCPFSCNYEVVNSCASCGPVPSCGARPDCSPCSYDAVKDECIVPSCGPAPGCGVCGCVPAPETKSKSCSGTTKTSRIEFTFVADVYSKYSSEDPTGFIPSKSLNMVPVVAKQLPYDTLKFNYMTHSCSVIKIGQPVTTDLKEDISACPLPAGLTPV